MNISVSKDNQVVLNIDLTQEVSALGNSEAVFYIGRAKDCTVVLDDRTISRIHAELHYSNHQWKLVASSGFGSLLVNGQPIKDKILEPGDSASCGPYILNFQFIIAESQPSSEELVEEEVIEDLVEVEDSSPEMTETFIEEAPQVEMVTEEDAGLVQEEEFDDDFGDNVQEEPVSETFGEETSEISAEDATVEDDISFDNGEEDFAIIPEDDDGDDLNESTRVLQTFVDLYFEISGEYAPYDKFVLDDKEVFIGRDSSKCKLVINDPEISSVHAVIRKNNITCTIEDLQSANGTLVNGEAVNKQDLSNGDEVLLGSTTLTLRIKSDFFKQEEDRLMPVEEGQEIEVQEIVEVDEDFDDTGMQEFGDQTGAPKSNSLFSKEALKDPVKRKKILYGLIGLLALWVLLDEEPAKKPAPKQSKEDARLLESQKQGVNTTNPNEKKLTPEELAMVESTYLLAKELIDVGKFNEALIELDKIKRIQASYKNTLQLEALAKQKIAEIEALNRKQREEEEKRLRMEKVKLLVEEAKSATEKKQVQLAEGLFAKIIELDPENFEVSRLKLEIDSYKREQERIEIERAAKEAERKRQLDALAPGKGHYLKSEWYKAIQRLGSFLLEKSIDEDLRDEATKMLTESKENLNNIIQPMLGKARSLKEGQDLKGAYEQYAEILKLDQGSTEALNEMDEIRDILIARSKKIYREAIISESLSLFDDAKEKFKEVQQISPSDSEYYEKATNRLKEYLE